MRCPIFFRYFTNSLLSLGRPYLHQLKSDHDPGVVGREVNKQRLLLLVEVRARFRDKATKTNESFLLLERWIDEGRQTRPGSTHLDLHVAGGQIVLTNGLGFDMAYALRFTCITSPEP